MVQGNGQFWRMRKESLMKVENYYRNKSTSLLHERDLSFSKLSSLNLQVSGETAVIPCMGVVCVVCPPLLEISRYKYQLSCPQN